MSLRLSVCIATRNRREDLTRTLAALEKLDPAPDEVRITADGCTDGTIEFVRTHYPRHSLTINDPARGSIPSRDAMMRATDCELLLSIDDDSYPVEADFIARCREIFAQHSRAAVLSFPQRSDEFPESLTQADFGPARMDGSFANSGAVFRRSVFLELGGYPGFFAHAYEEPDFALRCAAAGWQVRFEPSLTIRHHYTSMQRNEMRTHQRHARNELWSVLMRCPAPQLFAVALFRTARQFGYAWHRGMGWAIREPAWWLACLRGLPQCLAARRPVAWSAYLRWMRLVRRPMASEQEFVAAFGEPTPAQNPPSPSPAGVA